MAVDTYPSVTGSRSTPEDSAVGYRTLQSLAAVPLLLTVHKVTRTPQSLAAVPLMYTFLWVPTTPQSLAVVPLL
ncbi:hypothetical protein DPMN_154262 [Dreissena polymorpha]|uniref:Uncharacterized protein n=1 Tax=Dreissena polymorpha TaxID=45954 RepID=A0A9D4FN40_DREPO|nr:hypothetical protein DPMN_154262 [Dreissena polymorpha]